MNNSTIKPLYKTSFEYYTVEPHARYASFMDDWKNNLYGTSGPTFTMGYDMDNIKYPSKLWFKFQVFLANKLLRVGCSIHNKIGSHDYLMVCLINRIVKRLLNINMIESEPDIIYKEISDQDRFILAANELKDIFVNE